MVFEILSFCNCLNFLRSVSVQNSNVIFCPNILVVIRLWCTLKAYRRAMKRRPRMTGFEMFFLLKQMGFQNKHCFDKHELLKFHILIALRTGLLH